MNNDGEIEVEDDADDSFSMNEPEIREIVQVRETRSSKQRNFDETGPPLSY